ncbi:MAG: FAD-binding oxidoreductase [Candidatus Pacebacteria bacterium]|nr:FAD-binding oxidoreductase [Candidatus Paceibacterota bacterium]
MENLKGFLGQNNIEYSTEEDILEKNSEDTSLFKIVPKIVVFPKNKEEISKISRFANENVGFNITGRSGGTDMSGGSINDSIILSFTKYFNKIISINKNNKEAVVEPGVFYRDFEVETLKQNLLLPSFPASRDICALGGMISNNSGGELSLQYGQTKNYVEEIECVLSNGEIMTIKALKENEVIKKIDEASDEFKNTLEYKIYNDMYTLIKNENNQQIIKRNTPITSKNSSGYFLWDLLKEKKGENIFDLNKIIVGSQGTLGILTKVKLKLIEPKKHTKMLLIFIKDLKDLGKIRSIVMRYNPESFESYDDHTFKVAMKFFPALIKNIFLKNKNKGSFALIKMVFSFWKEAFLVLTFGMPKLILLAEFTGDDEEEILNRVNKCDEEISDNFTKNVKTEIVKTVYEEEKYWTMRRESFNLLREKVKGLHTAPYIDDVVVPGEKLEEFLEELIPILDKYDLLYTVAGHVGDGNLHIIPLMNFDDPKVKEKNLKIINDCGIEVYNLVKKYHGSITAEHNDGLIRTPFLDEIFDKEMLALFRQVKNIFDPKNILNPRKKVSIHEENRKDFDDNLKFVKFK